MTNVTTLCGTVAFVLVLSVSREVARAAGQAALARSRERWSTAAARRAWRDGHLPDRAGH
jgi:hypothetical protein